jgi:DNA-binding MarR family transcriptional regulator
MLTNSETADVVLPVIVVQAPPTSAPAPGSDIVVSNKALPDADRKAVRSALRFLEPFRDIRSTMPLQYVTAFLLVAYEEGLGVGDYATKAGVSVSVMSRHLLDIGDRNRHMTEGFGLVTYRSNPMELRKHEYMLTDKGRALAHRILRQLDN